MHGSTAKTSTAADDYTLGYRLWTGLSITISQGDPGKEEKVDSPTYYK
jgi:hypothetical protein